MISIHAAREGGDCPPDKAAQLRAISIHAAREGGDAIAIGATVPPVGFQSTPPVKAATFPVLRSIRLLKFQSTPPVKAATLADP